MSPRPAKATTPAPENVPSLDELLDNKPSEPETVETPVEDVKPELTPEQAEIQRLRDELAAEDAKKNLRPTDDTGKPVGESVLTPEQREIRLLEDRLAAKRADNILTQRDEFENAEGGKIIHFVADGLTTQGRTWLTGQTLSFGATAYEQTKDRFGQSWLDYSEQEQYRKFGKVYFREGPWQGATYEDAVATEDKTRGFAAPLISI